MFTIIGTVMDKKDVMYGVAAVAIILFMALVAKPVMTGQPVNTGLPTPLPTPTATTPVLAHHPCLDAGYVLKNTDSDAGAHLEHFCPDRWFCEFFCVRCQFRGRSPQWHPF